RQFYKDNPRRAAEMGISADGSFDLVKFRGTPTRHAAPAPQKPLPGLFEAQEALDRSLGTRNSSDPYFAHPLPGATLGDDIHAKRTHGQHGAQDIIAPVGTPILALADGIVIAKHDFGNEGAGCHIYVRHSGG